MSEKRDKWEKADIIAKIFIPVIVAVVGGVYTYQQDQREEARKRFSNIVQLVQELPKGNVREQDIILSMLTTEIKKSSEVVKDDIRPIVIPEVIRYIDNATRKSIADKAKKLVEDLAPDTGSLQFETKTFNVNVARIFVHIRHEKQRIKAKSDIQLFIANLGDDFIVPGIQKVSFGPNETQLRYFLPDDKKEAKEIAKKLKDSGLGEVTHKIVKGYENVKGMRPRTYELWYKP